MGEQPFIPMENMLILQESCIDHLGSLIVYAPVDAPSINAAVSGKDSSIIPLLPSGFIICGDNSLNPSFNPDAVASSSVGQAMRMGSGSLLTVAFQILAASPSTDNQLNMGSIATINTLVSSTVQRIKVALS